MTPPIPPTAKDNLNQKTGSLLYKATYQNDPSVRTRAVFAGNFSSYNGATVGGSDPIKKGGRRERAVHTTIRPTLLLFPYSIRAHTHAGDRSI